MNKRILVWMGDIHIPHADAFAVKKAIKIAQAANADTIIVGGDLLDFYSLSRFDKDPARKTSVKYEIQLGRKFLKDLRAKFPHAEIVMLEGNHEFRLKRYLWGTELSDFEEMSLPSLLGLDKLGIEYYDYGDPYFVTDNFIAVHGDVVRKNSGYSAHGEMQKWGMSGISGHVHRLGQIYNTKLSGTRCWVEAGCLCSLNPEYIRQPDWQQGVVVLEVRGNEVYPELVRIDNKTVFRGKKV